MKIILKEDVVNLGKGGQVVKVKDGYARNFLIPRNMAVQATTKNINQLTHEQTMIQQGLSKRLKAAETMAERLKEISVTISRLVGENERLFGSVTTKDIEEALREEGVVMEKHNILLGEPIKALGVYHVPVKVHSSVTAEVKVWVVAK